MMQGVGAGVANSWAMFSNTAQNVAMRLAENGRDSLEKKKKRKLQVVLLRWHIKTNMGLWTAGRHRVEPSLMELYASPLLIF